MNKQYILLDLDGTLADPKAGITKSVQYSLRSFGINIEDRDALIPFIGPPLRDSYRLFYGFNEADAELAVGKFREYFAETGIFENTLYGGIPELLESLTASGKTLILATSKAAVYAARILEHFDISRYFSFVSGSELDGTRSVKSEVIGYALKKCGVNSVGDAIMVGDREHDVLGARAHGMESVGVLYGYGSHRELSDAGAAFIVESIGELSRLLNSGE